MLGVFKALTPGCGSDGRENWKAAGAVGLFFFSSRGRHTRCGRDWSSDVCSSDLLFFGDLSLSISVFLPAISVKPTAFDSSFLLAQTLYRSWLCFGSALSGDCTRFRLNSTGLLWLNNPVATVYTVCLPLLPMGLLCGCAFRAVILLISDNHPTEHLPKPNFVAVHQSFRLI